ncbi:MAG TPA: hypothetical protein VFZ64_09920 [Nocardioidaceae bacterium]
MNKLIFTADPDAALTFTSARSTEVDNPPLVTRDPRLDGALQSRRLDATLQRRMATHAEEPNR